MLRWSFLLIGLILVTVCALPVSAADRKAEDIPLGADLMEQTGDLWVELEAYFARDLVQEVLTKDARKELKSVLESKPGQALLLVGHARAKALQNQKSPPPFGKIKGARMLAVDEVESETNALHELLISFLGRLGQSKVADREFDDEVWGDPVQDSEDGRELAAKLTRLQGNFKQMKDSVIQNIR